MALIDENMVVRRAKERSKQDGFTWYFDFNPRRAANDGRLLSEARRRLYLEKARHKLRLEADARR